MNTLEELVAKAIRLGADALDVDYKDHREQVAAMRGSFGVGIASIPSSSPEAQELERELHAIAKKRRRLTVGEFEYELRVHIRDSFGEDAFRLQVRRLPARASAAKQSRGATKH